MFEQPPLDDAQIVHFIELDVGSNPTVELTGRAQTRKPRKPRADKFAVRARVQRFVRARPIVTRSKTAPPTMAASRRMSARLR
ncbi:MAG: hypothetical protein DMF73_09560 [Acidobacteria bacterium]|nr:MAG: hypothetical protein DMF73_09560 [Acidobacteriota bacterium]